jgi:hypothetical protein
MLDAFFAVHFSLPFEKFPSGRQNTEEYEFVECKKRENVNIRHAETM